MTEIFILDYHDHVTKIIVTIFILNSRRPMVQMRPNLKNPNGGGSKFLCEKSVHHDFKLKIEGICYPRIFGS